MRYMIYGTMMLLIVAGCGESGKAEPVKSGDVAAKRVEGAVEKVEGAEESKEGAADADASPEQGGGKAGSMRIAGVEPIDTPPPPSILPNGDFRDWPAGEPAPKGYQPPSPKYSVIMRQPKNDGGFEVKQTWTANDYAKASQDRFGVLVEVKPDTQYILEVTATNPDKANAEIVLMTQAEDKKRDLLANHFITIKASSPSTTYSNVFETGKTRLVLIIPGLCANEPTPSSVIWSKFAVRPVE